MFKRDIICTEGPDQLVIKSGDLVYPDKYIISWEDKRANQMASMVFSREQLLQLKNVIDKL